MDGDTRFFFASSLNRFVNEMAIHTFSAVFREEGRVYIDDLIWEGLDQANGYFPEKSGQYDEIRLVRSQNIGIPIPSEKKFFFDDEGRNMFVCGDVQYAGLRFIGDDEYDTHGRVVSKKIDDVLGV